MLGPGTAVVHELDLADLDSVDLFAKTVVEAYDGLSRRSCATPA